MNRIIRILKNIRGNIPDFLDYVLGVSWLFGSIYLIYIKSKWGFALLLVPLWILLAVLVIFPFVYIYDEFIKGARGFKGLFLALVSSIGTIIIYIFLLWLLYNSVNPRMLP